MPIFNLFSKRQRRARGEFPDVYVYDELPQPLRVQIVHIIRDAFGVDHYGSDHSDNAYQFVSDALCREYGIFELTKHARSAQESVFNFFLQEKSLERALDVVETCFKVIELVAEDYRFRGGTDRNLEAKEAIDELNERLKEHGIGYRFESGEVLRVDSEFLHSEVVKPVLGLLRGNEFKGANEEFLSAHEHYRHGRNKDALVHALKAFESTMKTICKKRGWPYEEAATAKALTNICISEGLLPSYLEAQFGALRSVLESGVPTIRNKQGAHGQGANLIEVPDFLARYALNLTASNVLFLVEADAK